MAERTRGAGGNAGATSLRGRDADVGRDHDRDHDLALLVVLATAYGLGGYAAGRMARFDGARQGFGVWLWGIIAALVVAALALVGGSQYNVLDALSLPRLPVDSGTLTTGGAIALAASLVVTLLAAMLGGKAGERFHRKVDRVGTPH